MYLDWWFCISQQISESNEISQIRMSHTKSTLFYYINLSKDAPSGQSDHTDSSIDQDW